MWAVGIHAGAAPINGFRPEVDIPVLRSALDFAVESLSNGGGALDVAEAAIRTLEDSANFIAGKGACPNSLGQFELDAALCDGSARRAGAVAAMVGAYPPISIARAVMERTNNVLLVGPGATAFALNQGFDSIEKPDAFFAPSSNVKGDPDALVHGTVGAVVLDSHGHIAAGTSTGGLIGKRPGRVGDSPIVGAGTWADRNIGVSCTGQGEFFLRTAAAHSVAARYAYERLPLQEALYAIVREIGHLGGEGGLISVDVRGTVRYAFNTEGMRVALATSAGDNYVGVARRGLPGPEI